jgi:hypothetical protein
VCSSDLFTRPLPVSILKGIAAEKNTMDLPKFDDASLPTSAVIQQQMPQTGQPYKPQKQIEPPKVENILPRPESRTTNPNLHIYSEEIAK